jgi:OmpA-OmpF porin, OOP family
MFQIKISTKAKQQKATLLFVVILFCTHSFAQKTTKNLVPNAGFETHKSKSAVIKNAIPWLGVGTVDYYMKPDKKDTSMYKGAHTGKCYAGLRFQPNYKEYLYVKLTEQLVKGNAYYFKMYVRLLDKSSVSVKQLGVYFSDDAFKIGMGFEDDGLIDSTYRKGISGNHNWIPIQGKYYAQGGEQYIIIGNFRTVMKDDFVRKNKWDIFETREAYYYIDDISVLRPDTVKNAVPVNRNPPKRINSYITGQVIEIKNVQFESGNAVLTKESYKALDDFIKILNQQPYMEIQINGHTDNEGRDAANLKLSTERAKAVYDYLSNEGVLNPIKYVGYGSSKPLVPNNTEEHKAKNRRVEFVVLKQQK